MKALVAMTPFFMLSGFAWSQENPQPPKAPQTCQQQCQPLGKVQVCNKHCWSYRGGPGSVLVQTTVTWSSGAPTLAQRAKPKPQVSSNE